MSKHRKTRRRRSSAQVAAFRKMIAARAGNPRRRSSRRSYNPSGRSRRRNFGFRRHRRRSNPAAFGMSFTEVLKLTAGGMAGGFGARTLPQLVLGASNTGWMGYLANLVATGVLTWGARKFFGDKAATGVLVGGLTVTGWRIWTDNVSGTTAAAALNGLGDIDVSDTGLGWYGPIDYNQGHGGPYIAAGAGAPAPATPAGKAAAVAAAGGRTPGALVQMPNRGRD